MKLAKNWTIKTDNEYWLVLENEIENQRLVFGKPSCLYRVEPIDAFEEDEEVAFWFNLQEHEMISNIINELRGCIND